ncbi:MAG TPA: DUF2845 domain-containing protein [Gammaproteobacteria bacterium]
MKHALLGWVIGACLAAANATADEVPLRCDGKIIQRGFSVAYVLSLCGAPELHWRSEVPARARNPQGFTYFSGFSLTERLVYDRGYGRFPAELEFVDGELRRIERLPHRR